MITLEDEEDESGGSAADPKQKSISKQLTNRYREVAEALESVKKAMKLSDLDESRLVNLVPPNLFVNYLLLLDIVIRGLRIIPVRSNYVELFGKSIIWTFG